METNQKPFIPSMSLAETEEKVMSAVTAAIDGNFDGFFSTASKLGASILEEEKINALKAKEVASEAKEAKKLKKKKEEEVWTRKDNKTTPTTLTIEKEQALLSKQRATASSKAEDDMTKLSNDLYFDEDTQRYEQAVNTVLSDSSTEHEPAQLPAYFPPLAQPSSGADHTYTTSYQEKTDKKDTNPDGSTTHVHKTVTKKMLNQDVSVMDKTYPRSKGEDLAKRSVAAFVPSTNFIRNTHAIMLQNKDVVKASKIEGERDVFYAPLLVESSKMVAAANSIKAIKYLDNEGDDVGVNFEKRLKLTTAEKAPVVNTGTLSDMY